MELFSAMCVGKYDMMVSLRFITKFVNMFMVNKNLVDNKYESLVMYK